MTVIAIRDGVVAADSAVSLTEWSMTYGAVDKIKMINGWIIGGAGNLAQVQQFMRWMGGSRTEPVWDHIVCFALRPDGQLLEFDHCKRPYQMTTHCGHAIGSGCNTAIAAMMAGADAVRAVEITVELDQACGGPIKIIKQ